MDDTNTTDITLYLESHGNLSVQLTKPALYLAINLVKVISIGSVGKSGEEIISGLKCWHSLQDKSCDGHLKIFRIDVPTIIKWNCPKCNIDGAITNWKGTYWDFSGLVKKNNNSYKKNLCKLYLKDNEYQLLMEINIADPESIIIVLKAKHSNPGILLSAPVDKMKNLLEFVTSTINNDYSKNKRIILNNIIIKMSEEINSVSN